MKDLVQISAAFESMLSEAPEGAEIFFGMLGVMIVASAVKGTIRSKEDASVGGGNPSSVCPVCFRGASAPCAPGCKFRERGVK